MICSLKVPAFCETFLSVFDRDSVKYIRKERFIILLSNNGEFLFKMTL